MKAPHFFRRLGKEKRGLSTVIGATLFMILILGSTSVLFVALFRYNADVKLANNIEELRSEEQIMLVPLFANETDGTTLTAIRIRNVASITSRVRAVYVDNLFWCDPSDTGLNSNGAYIAPQTTELISITPLTYSPTSKIAVATERGVRAIEYESNLLNSQDQPSNPVTTNYGPLRLNFTLFSYHETDDVGNFLGPWWWGWEVPESTLGAWNVTVTNIDNRNITLNQYSCLTLVSNDNGAQSPWYINSTSTTINVNQTVSLIYTWKEPLTQSRTVQDIKYGGQEPTFKVFLTFFGKFSDGSTYGQTIPFEAVLVI